MVATAQLTGDFLHIVSATIPQSGARRKPLPTVRVAERDAERAVADIEKLAGVTGRVRRIRVVDLENSNDE